MWEEVTTFGDASSFAKSVSGPIPLFAYLPGYQAELHPTGLKIWASVTASLCILLTLKKKKVPFTTT